MAGGFGGAPTGLPHHRIKGRGASAFRFFMIAVGYMAGWVLLTSLLTYYSHWFGPQILLEMNGAFYLSSIPVLVLSGLVEKLLDRRYGQVMSMSIRLNVGLVGSAAVVAFFPFMPASHAVLLWLVAVLGMLSAVAFSTAYQLVQSFRHADIIALGIGGVGSGPLIMVLQLMLGVGPLPSRWQWIAMFEAVAAVVVVGCVCSSSLFAQYWKVLVGEDEPTPHGDTSNRVPSQLQLPPAGAGAATGAGPAAAAAAAAAPAATVGAPEGAVAAGAAFPGVVAVAGLGASSGGGALGGRARSLPTPHGPRQHGVMTEAEAAEEAQEAAAMALAAAPTKNVLLAPDPFQGLPVLLQSQSFRAGSGWEAAVFEPPPLLEQQSGAGGRPLRGPSGSGARRQGSQAGSRASSGSGARRTTSIGGAGSKPAGLGSHASDSQLQLLQHRQPLLDPSHVASHEEGVDAGPRAGPQWEGELEGGKSGVEACVPGEPEGRSVAEETREVMAGCWHVLLAFSASVTTLYLVFPFFTFVPSKREALPQWLFFTRIYADILGRFLPRRKSLMVQSPITLLVITTVKLLAVVMFFVYIKGPLQNDYFSCALIAFIWLVGGYVNTSANILAPNLVEPSLTVRAAALISLAFQIAHFLGLMLAALLMWMLYGKELHE